MRRFAATWRHRPKASMTPPSRRPLSACVALLLLPLLAACGAADRSEWRSAGGESNGVALMNSRDALREAHRSMTGLTDAVYRGRAEVAGAADVGRWRLRMTSTSGGACEFRFRSRARSFTMRQVDGALYMRANPVFMREAWGYGPLQVEAVRGYWILLPVPDGGFPVCGLGSLVPRPTSRGGYDGAGFTEVDGQRARRFERRAADSVAVATTGEPRLLAKTGGLGGEDRFRVRLAETDSGAELVEPPPSRVIDPGFEEGGDDGTVPIRYAGAGDPAPRAQRTSSATLNATRHTRPTSPTTIANVAAIRMVRVWSISPER
jgi:hypothetical protein